MERYEIYRDRRFVAGFNEGDMSRFGVPFDREVAMREFDSCVNVWEERSKTGFNWELRVCLLLKMDRERRNYGRIGKTA